MAKLGEITGETRDLYSKWGKLQVKLEFCHVGYRQNIGRVIFIVIGEILLYMEEIPDVVTLFKTGQLCMFP